MSTTTRPRRQHSGAVIGSFVGRRSNVVLVGVAMIVVQLAYRAWALYGGWFLIDDYAFLAGAVDADLTLDYLFTPYGDHLQPLGFLIVWLVGQSTAYNWALASTITLVLQALASGACLAFLIRLCGARWATLVPLGFYLFATITIPAFMWWAAAVVQVPLQLAAFCAMAAHVEYVRTRQHRYIALTAAALVLGMLCDVKVALIGLSLAFLSLYLSDARGFGPRLKDALGRQWLAWVTYGTLFIGYLVLYLSLNSVGEREPEAFGSIFEVMSRYTLGPVMVGGPWRWREMGDTPLVPVQPPEWAVTMAWVTIALLIAWAVRRRPATSWVGALLVPAVTINVAMLATARGSIFGGLAGLELRYSGDLAPTLVLVVAVLAAGLRSSALPPVEPIVFGGHHGSTSTTASTRPSNWQIVTGATLVLAALIGSFISTTAYVKNWHTAYPARQYFENVLAQSQQRQLVLLDQEVPLNVLPREGPSKFELPSQVFTPLGERLVASERMNDPEVLDPMGNAYKASIDARRQSPEGPADGCGYLIDFKPSSIPIEQLPEREPVSDVWWASVAYLASGNGVTTLTINGLATDMEVKGGLHDFFFLGSGPADQLTLQARSDVTVCVDTVRVGVLAPNGRVDQQ